MRHSQESKDLNSDKEQDSMANIPTPPVDIIIQSTLEGKQILPKPSYLSFFTSFCNCFRLSDTHKLRSESVCLLNPKMPEDIQRNTLVLDLDETLVHSSFTEIPCDISLQIEVEGIKYDVYVLKRPGVDKFLEKCSELFEVVIFTASLSNYAEPLLNLLDPEKRIHYRLSRESCSFINSNFVKDLSKLGRDLKNVIIIDVIYN